MPVKLRRLATQAKKPSRKIASIREPRPTQAKPAPVVGTWKPNDTQRLLTVRDAATYFGCSLWQVRRLLRNGDVPRIRLGNHDMVDRADLDAFIENLKGGVA